MRVSDVACAFEGGILKALALNLSICRQIGKASQRISNTVSSVHTSLQSCLINLTTAFQGQSHKMSCCVGYTQRSTRLAPQLSPQLSKPSLCSRCQRARHVTAAYQSNNGPAAGYRPHSQATRAATAPEPQFSTDTVAGGMQWLRVSDSLLQCFGIRMVSTSCRLLQDQ